MSFVKAPLMVSVPVAVYSLQMTTFIHQSQLRSTLGIPRSTSFQCYLSLLLLHLLFFFTKELSFYCKYPSRLSAPFRVRVALQQGRLLVQLGHTAWPVRKYTVRLPLVLFGHQKKSAEGKVRPAHQPCSVALNPLANISTPVCVCFF